MEARTRSGGQGTVTDCGRTAGVVRAYCGSNEAAREASNTKRHNHNINNPPSSTHVHGAHSF